MKITRVERKLGASTLVIETGKVAKQAHGAVTVQYGDTVALATVLAAPSSRDLDFFPLYVDYREMQYAGGKFPGGFFKREGRPSSKEILTARLIDRPLRPLFPDDFVDEVQIQVMVISADKDYDGDVLAVIGGGASVSLSHAPFDGPIGCVRVAHVNGEMILFPSYPQRAQSDLDLVVSGSRNAINMIEMDGKEVDDQVVVEACRFAHEAIKQICDMVDELVAKAGQPKKYTAHPLDPKLMELVLQGYGKKIRQIKQIAGKTERNDTMSALADQAVAELCPAGADPAATPLPPDVRKAFYKVEGKVQRQLLLEGIRPDGRKAKEVRPICIESPALPRTHGSAIFSRGETQALATVTLGTPRDQQKIDGLQEEYMKRFMLHYNFPPFSVGEIRPVRGPSRRDIGHGTLAEKSLEPILPSQESFPYTIRVVSEILESNGSSSMATVCGGCMALLDAGVPITASVAGISIGLVREKGRKILITDILGEEDFHGDMDFKVAGTRKGITGIQLDFKPSDGLDVETIAETLSQAKEARLHVLAEMDKVLANPRPQLSQFAPRMITLKIDPEKIGKVIGPGGKTINSLSQRFNVTIDVEDDGSIFVSGLDAAAAEAARAEIELITEEVKIGRVYTGKVVGIKDFGVFVELAPGKDGLCHVSELDEKFVKNVTDVVKLGDVLTVKVVAIDDQGRVKLSRKAVMKEQAEDKS
jgi:polyribonucleotide nucleotidyltransferase